MAPCRDAYATSTFIILSFRPFVVFTDQHQGSHPVSATAATETAAVASIIDISMSGRDPPVDHTWRRVVPRTDDPVMVYCVGTVGV